ncbi:hypothetical protein AK812_SmicGene46467 [Symbiodinium microadriaticum]|uniref:Uncharacterized protein n=1 Tax=Symbiodinium microadriaticum TaxID=2951 RepID=A0A1Q9BTU7_SYMMI|nr:hypothetical protein AK812_SmicGene46467 [Symbiodinium microadriaticum]CAE7390151.1 unnamed protein product [Symbiodinium microadriaticum]CAE7509547.1 unnamed protein product [Symbiodinium sp. KB8]
MAWEYAVVPHDSIHEFYPVWPFLGWRAASTGLSSLWATVLRKDEEGIYPCVIRGSGFTASAKYYCTQRMFLAVQLESSLLIYKHTQNQQVVVAKPIRKIKAEFFVEAATVLSVRLTLRLEACIEIENGPNGSSESCSIEILMNTDKKVEDLRDLSIHHARQQFTEREVVSSQDSWYFLQCLMVEHRKDRLGYWIEAARPVAVAE